MTKSFYYLSLFFFATSFMACGALSFYESPNDMRNLDGTLYLQNGKTMTGRLIIQTESLFASPVQLVANPGEKAMHFDLAHVKAYRLGDAYFEPKKIGGAAPGFSRTVFMKRLTPAGSRLHLFEHLRGENVNKTATRYSSEMYVATQGAEEGTVVHAGDFKLLNETNNSTGGLFSDCPALAKKISEETKGYSYRKGTPISQVKAVLLRIVMEYNTCGDSKLSTNEKSSDGE